MHARTHLPPAVPMAGDPYVCTGPLNHTVEGPTLCPSDQSKLTHRDTSLWLSLRTQLLRLSARGIGSPLRTAHMGQPFELGILVWSGGGSTVWVGITTHSREPGELCSQFPSITGETGGWVVLDGRVCAGQE